MRNRRQELASGSRDALKFAIFGLDPDGVLVLLLGPDSFGYVLFDPDNVNNFATRVENWCDGDFFRIFSSIFLSVGVRPASRLSMSEAGPYFFFDMPLGRVDRPHV